jgi:hypothetical protein
VDKGEVKKVVATVSDLNRACRGNVCRGCLTGLEVSGILTLCGLTRSGNGAVYYRKLRCLKWRCPETQGTVHLFVSKLLSLRFTVQCDVTFCFEVCHPRCVFKL